MTKLGTQNQWAVDHEEAVALVLGGKRVRGSGSTDTRKGDVHVPDVEVLVECKYSGYPSKPAKSISIKLADLEKITDEAYASNATPLLAARIHAENGPEDWVMVPLGDLAYLLDLARQMSAGNT